MAKKIWIFGIGKLGSQIVKQLVSNLDVDMVLVDKNEEVLAEYEDLEVTLHKCDTRIFKNVENLDIDKSKDVALVLFSNDILASILTCQNLFELDLKKIHVQVIDANQKKIINRLGKVNFIDINVVTAEKISIEVIKELEINRVYGDFLITKIKNEKIKNKKIKELNIRKKYQVNIILLIKKSEDKEQKKKIITPAPEEKIELGDEIICLIPEKKIDNVIKLFKK